MLELGYCWALMPTFGEQQHPCVLFRGFDVDDPQYQAMSRLVPTAQLMPEKGWGGVRPAEWDIIVSKGPELDADLHMHVLALGCARLGRTWNYHLATVVDYEGLQPSKRMEVPDDLPGRLRRLITSELIPGLQALPERPYLRFLSASGTPPGAMRLDPPTRQLEKLPFVLDPEQNIIAGAFERRRDRWCWALPFMPEHPELWFAAALEDWHGKTPQLVPLAPGWTSREAWMTQDEIALRADLEALELERARIAEDLNSRELELKAAQSAASSSADDGIRRLLTAQGEPLVVATAEALRQLKFDVEVVDEGLPPGTAKVEDLRLTDQDEPSWTNITEVRGYAAGAKLTDLQRIGRFAELYVQRNRKLPVSRWYLVNQFLDADPDRRQPPLLGAEDDVRVFAQNGGLVVDTRELFQITRAVQEGHISPADARRLLRSATGVFKFDYKPG
jgi:hypothetical protein